MIVAVSMGLAARTASGQVGVMVLTVVGMSFTWPTLEALVSEGEPRSGLQHMVVIYNVVWAATAALGNFSGGAMLEKLGLASLFYVPLAIHAGQLGVIFWLESKADSRQPAGTAGQGGPAPELGAALPKINPFRGSQQSAAAPCLASCGPEQGLARSRHALGLGQTGAGSSAEATAVVPAIPPSVTSELP